MSFKMNPGRFLLGGLRGPQNYFLKIFLILGFAIPVLSVSPAVADKPNAGQFTSVTGQVTVASPGQKPIPATVGAPVSAGDRITAAPGSKAVLTFFDGSRLNISESTDFTISQLQKPTALDKVFHFKMALGSLLAEVKKLASPKSSFEIEAGGVVCGVRGTRFSMDYDPSQSKVDLRVSEGSVFADSGNVHRVLHAGEQLEFLRGAPVASATTSEPKGNNRATAGEVALGAINNPSFMEFHNQFAGGVRAYIDSIIQDPAASGLQYRLNGPVSIFLPSSGKFYPNPGIYVGVILAHP